MRSYVTTHVQYPEKWTRNSSISEINDSEISTHYSFLKAAHLKMSLSRLSLKSTWLSLRVYIVCFRFRSSVLSQSALSASSQKRRRGPQAPSTGSSLKPPPASEIDESQISSQRNSSRLPLKASLSQSFPQTLRDDLARSRHGRTRSSQDRNKSHTGESQQFYVFFLL